MTKGRVTTSRTRQTSGKTREGKQTALALRILEALNQDGNQRELIGNILRLVKEFAGCEAAGIRLTEGEDFPYYETNGFSDEFVLAESSLCIRDPNGWLIRDDVGNPVLECMCGNIICGRFDLEKPFFTRNGSFWTNSTTELLVNTTEEDRRARTRNRCNGEGYESVALVPLRFRGSTIGLLQLNDRRRDCFTPQLVQFYEGVGESIAIILARKQAEDSLKEYRDHLEELVETRTAELQDTNERLRRHITKRKRAEKALAQSEEWHRALVDTVGNANLAIAVFRDRQDREGSILFANDQLCDLLGYSREELLWMSAADLLPRADLESARDRYQKRQHGQDVISYYQATLRRKDDTLVPIEASVGTMTYQGKAAVVSFFRDTTGRKLVDEELARHQYRLAELVEERTDELRSTIERLRLEIERREHAEERLREHFERERDLRQQVETQMIRRMKFARALAHDLKTPLTAMMLSSETLAGELKEEPLLSVAEALNRSVAKISCRIEGLLDLAEGEMGMLRLKAEPLNLTDVLIDALEEMRPLASSRRQHLISKVPGTLPQVKADAGKVRQIALNLLDNALKYTPEGGTVTLSASEKDNELVVEVRDTGLGIPEHAQQRLFEPYEQLDSHRDHYSGIGLGLALCRMFVDLHGGRIWVTSRPGKGSTFGFSLPRKRAEG